MDLGLPSGLLWAKCNLGATTPEGYVDYYAWGEVATKEVYRWSTYKYCTVDAHGALQTFTKYNTTPGYGITPYGTPDNLTTLQAIDDVATQKLGDGARMPTPAEWRELCDNATAEWTTVNGVVGAEFTAANGNSLFLPASGVRYYDSEPYDVGSSGFYWSSSLQADDPRSAWGFDLSVPGLDGLGTRCYGHTVRPVRSAR